MCKGKKKEACSAVKGTKRAKRRLIVQSRPEGGYGDARARHKITSSAPVPVSVHVVVHAICQTKISGPRVRLPRASSSRSCFVLLHSESGALTSRMMPPPEHVMQAMTTVVRGCKPRRIPCCVPATQKEANPMVSTACDSQPSIPVPMLDRNLIRETMGHEMKVDRAVATHIPKYSFWGRGSDTSHIACRMGTCRVNRESWA